MHSGVNMRLFYDNGITIDTGHKKLILDPSRKVLNYKDTFVGISHAHSDHIRNHDAQIISTKPTLDLAPFLNGTSLDFDEAFKFDGVEIKLRKSNHVLGSCQFEITSEEGTLVYTGDFKLQQSLLFEPCYIPKCDALVLESTYGLPHFKFPSFDSVYREVKEWVLDTLASKKNVLLGGYPLGKSQEIIKILNTFGIVPVVHPRINKVNRVYQENGVKLEYIDSSTEEGKEIMEHNFVGVIPSHLMKRTFFESMKSQTEKEFRSAFLTGWGMMYNYPGVDKVFPLSDHADFYQLLEYVEKSGAEKVYTVHGYDRELASEIRRRLKIHARPLHSKQLKLGDF